MSVVSICVPNIFYLIQRARHHGVKGLFTRRQLTPIRIPASTAPRRFQRISNDGYRLKSADGLFEDPEVDYSVSVSANERREEGEPIVLSQVHIRRDVDVIENERWAPV